MSLRRSTTTLLACAGLALTQGDAQARIHPTPAGMDRGPKAENPDATLSPYFFVKSGDAERGQARADYEQAKSQGRSASLLEQHRPNVFQMNVANILPGDEIRVELSYTELLVRTEGTYAFVYPTVVGPRYAGRAGTDSSTGEPWVANPYTHAEAGPLRGPGWQPRRHREVPTGGRRGAVGPAPGSGEGGEHLPAHGPAAQARDAQGPAAPRVRLHHGHLRQPDGLPH